MFDINGLAFGHIKGEAPLLARDVPLAKNPSTGTAQQRLFLVLKVVLHAVVVISEVLRLSTKSRCSRCCRHISTAGSMSQLHEMPVGPQGASSSIGNDNP